MVIAPTGFVPAYLMVEMVDTMMTKGTKRTWVSGRTGVSNDGALLFNYTAACTRACARSFSCYSTPGRHHIHVHSSLKFFLMILVSFKL